MIILAQFTNQAQLAYNDSVINSNIAVGEILEVLSQLPVLYNKSFHDLCFVKKTGK